MTDDGLRVANPEIVLLHKATQLRRKDRRDFDRSLPLLSNQQRAWLGESIASLYPGHEWLGRIEDGH